MHVWARIAGRGYVVTPRAPFHCEQTEEGLRLAHDAEDGPKIALIAAAADGVCVELLPGTEELAEVAELLTAPDDSPSGGAWRIETHHFRHLWPASFGLISTEAPPGFEFVGAPAEEGGEGPLLYIQGPFPAEKIPPLESCLAPEQRLVGRGEFEEQPWIDVEYAHEGTPWRQRLYRVAFGSRRALLLTAQASAAQAPEACAAAETILSSLEVVRA